MNEGDFRKVTTKTSKTARHTWKRVDDVSGKFSNFSTQAWSAVNPGFHVNT